MPDTRAGLERVPSPSEGWPVSARLLAPYRRITSSGKFVPEVDGLRFIAILAVYIYHFAGDVLRHSPSGDGLALRGQWIFSITQILNIGVPLFFVISGFILGLPFAEARLDRQTISLKKYYLRRITRLEPPYLLCLLLFFVVKILARRGTAGQLLPNLFASMFYVHNLVYGAPSAINYVAWSLEIEVQFYILAPLLATLFAISNASLRRSFLAVLMLLATGVSGLVSADGALGHSLLGYAQYFLAGFLLVEFQLCGGLQRKGSVLWDFVSISGWCLLLALLVRGGRMAAWTAPWLMVLLYVAAFRGRAINHFVTNTWVATIGGMCYSIYLLHNYLIAALGMLTERFFSSYAFEWRLAIQFALITPAVLVLSAMYFRWVERPCMRPDWPRRVKAAFERPPIWYPSPAAAVSSQTSADD
ncbi:MAG: acyltransferase family protein [Bryobacteraceae bacterium]